VLNTNIGGKLKNGGQFIALKNLKHEHWSKSELKLWLGLKTGYKKLDATRINPKFISLL
jgi:hypothetical protein